MPTEQKCAWTLDQADQALALLLVTTIKQESLIAARDQRIASIQAEYAEELCEAARVTEALTSNIEAWFLAHGAQYLEDDKKSIQLAHGLVGTRLPANPALVPLNEKWPWDKIGRKLKRLFKARFFHAPKPPDIDKNKIKKALTPEQLATCGLKLDDTEKFYFELARLPQASKSAPIAA